MKSNQEIIIEKLQQLFSQEDFDEVVAVLDAYRSESGQDATEYVRLAALRMSNGKLERLRNYMRLARIDYRDLLVVAYEPISFRLQMTSKLRVSEEEERLAEQQDKEQFDSWLAGDHTPVCERCSGVGVVTQGQYVADSSMPLGLRMPEWVECSRCGGTGREVSS